MLRGPQTAGELRMNTERLHGFADISSVEAFLNELCERPAEDGGPLVTKLPRQPGEREQRWAQLLTGTPPVTAPVLQTIGAPVDAADLSAQVQRLAAEVEQLREELAALRAKVAEKGWQ